MNYAELTAVVVNCVAAIATSFSAFSAWKAASIARSQLKLSVDSARPFLMVDLCKGLPNESYNIKIQNSGLRPANQIKMEWVARVGQATDNTITFIERQEPWYLPPRRPEINGMLVSKQVADVNTHILPRANPIGIQVKIEYQDFYTRDPHSEESSWLIDKVNGYEQIRRLNDNEKIFKELQMAIKNTKASTPQTPQGSQP